MHLGLSKYLDGTTLQGLVIRVEHDTYGVLFAAMIKGTGSLLSIVDEQGLDLPFMTTDEILHEIQRFGFYVDYNVIENLPVNVITFLSNVLDLGFDKITRVSVVTKDAFAQEVVYKPTVLVIKSTEDNSDLLTFGCNLSEKKFMEKLSKNTIMNITYEKDMQWDWVKYIANISDLLDENFRNIEDIDMVSEDEVNN